MTAPVSHNTHDGATGTGASEPHGSKGHHTLSLFVSAPDVDPDTDALTVVVEASPDGDRWTTLTRSDGSEVALQAGDLNADGNGMAVVDGVITSELRVNVTDHSGGFEADTHLLLGGWPGPSHSV